MRSDRRPPENSRLVLLVALALWAGGVALAGVLGSFANLGLPLGTALAAFATAFAVATYYLDSGVRAAVDAADARTIVVLVAFGLAAIAGIVIEGASPALVARTPRVLIPLFVAPVTIALHVALLDRLLRAPGGTASSSSKAAKARGTHAAA